jgi:hypothetical protein
MPLSLRRVLQILASKFLHSLQDLFRCMKTKTNRTLDPDFHRHGRVDSFLPPNLFLTCLFILTVLYSNLFEVGEIPTFFLEREKFNGGLA